MYAPNNLHTKECIKQEEIQPQNKGYSIFYNVSVGAHIHSEKPLQVFKQNIKPKSDQRSADLV